MKNLFLILLLFSFSFAHSQKLETVLLVLKSGKQFTVQILSLERTKMQVSTESGKSVSVNAFDIESVNGFPYKTFFEENVEYYDAIKLANKDSEFKIFPNYNGQIEYSGIVYIDSSYSKDLLFDNAERWFVDQYRSAQDVIQYKNKDQGEITGKGIIQVYWKYGGILASTQVSVYHTVKLYFKDGRYKYVISPFNLSYYIPGDAYSAGTTMQLTLEEFIKRFFNRGKHTDDFYTDLDNEVKSLIKTLNKYMTSKPQQASDDW